MERNFDKSMTEAYKHEGGYVDHPSDPGGATNMGITIGTLSAARGYRVTKRDVRNLTRAEASGIYRRNYWDRVRGDDLPAGLDYVTFDAAINSGPARGAKWTQRALGVAADGKIGNLTIKAARAAQPIPAVKAACAERLRFLRSLRNWKTFGRGWGRRVAEVEVKAVVMAGATSVDLAREAKTAKKTRDAQVTGAVGGSAGSLSLPSTNLPELVTYGAVAVAVVVGVVLLMRAAQQGARHAAYVAAGANND